MEEIIQIQTKFNNIYEFYRDNGVKKMREVDFENYFYVKSNDLDNALKILSNESRDNDYVGDVGYISIYGDSLYKITPNKYEFWKFRKALRAAGIQTYEAWLDVNLKYLLHNSRKFSKERKVAVIDIENDGSLDCINAPKIITSICLYDYTLDKYFIWVLKNPNNDKIEDRPNDDLRIFDSEKEMMEDFCITFRDLDLDICGGWNSNNFDWPYIINRLKVLGIKPEELSNFGEVECRHFSIDGRINFDSEIRGVELIDFIPVLKKNTCYSPQPASFSLESTANFYLDTKKLVNIGFEAWKNNINDFIKYNVRDVELVKELIDKFKLIDFLMVIQSEISPVKLNNSTHNSVVLLYYLKIHFPNAIIPDNHGKITMEKDGNKEIINLNTSHIRIKAAHVIPAHAGIHSNVSVFDFAGLYPSIIRTFNMCPSTINLTSGTLVDDIIMWQIAGTAWEDEKSDTKEVLNEWIYKRYFSNDKIGIYPAILEDLTNRRNLHKHKLPELAEKYGKNSSEYLLSLYRSDVLKQISNSLFGVGGFNKFPLFDPWVAASITSIARKCIKKTEDWLINDYNYEVITGDSVTGNTTILVMHKNKKYLMKIEELIDKFPNIKTNRKDKDEYIFNDEIFTWSWNFKTEKSEFKKIKRFIRHKVIKKIHNISSKYSSFNVTEDHGFYDINNNLISSKEYPSRASISNIVNVPKKVKIDNLKFSNKVKEVNLLEISKKAIDYYMNNTNKKYKIIKNKNNFVLYNEYLHGKKKGQKYNIKKFPNKIKIDSNLGFVLGAYIAEGSVTRNGFSGLRIAAGDTKYIKEVFDILVKIFGPENIGLKDNNTRIVAGNFILSNLFKELGGYKSKNKQLPDFILDTNPKFFEGFLRGYTLGDGFHEHRFKTDKEHLKVGGVGSKSKKLASQLYFIMQNIYGYDNTQLRIRYRADKDFYSTAWDINTKNVSGCILQCKNELLNYSDVYDLEVEDNHNFIDIQGGVVLHNTDSVMVKHPEGINPKDLGEELNNKLKKWILEEFKIPENRYCMELEYEKTFKTFVMKDAKKKYYGILSDGTFQAKGFDIIQHVLSDKIKDMIKKIYIMLLEKKPTNEIKDEISKIKNEFYNLSYTEIAKDLKIAKNLEEYDTNIQHIRAAKYSNDYLGTDFKGGSVGKLIFIKGTKNPEKYPNTDVVLLDENTKLPDELIIDYDIIWEKLFLDKIRLLEDIEEMNISKILSKNKDLAEFF